MLSWKLLFHFESLISSVVMYKLFIRKSKHLLIKPLLIFLLSNHFYYQKKYNKEAPESTNLQMTFTLFLIFTLPIMFNLIMLLDLFVLIAGQNVFVDLIFKDNNILLLCLWIIPLYFYIRKLGGYSEIFKLAQKFEIVNKIKQTFPLMFIRISILTFLANMILWALVLSYLKSIK